MPKNSEIDVLDMVDGIDDDDFDTSKYFMKNPVSGNVKEEHDESSADPVMETSVKKPKGKTPWTPDPSLVSDMKELQQGAGVVYDREDIVDERPTVKLNVADDEASRESETAMNNLTRQVKNIEEAKMRHGITKLSIPANHKLSYEMHLASEDNNHRRAQESLDKIFEEIEREYPDFILERKDDLIQPDSDIPTMVGSDSTADDNIQTFESQEQAASAEEFPTMDSPEPMESHDFPSFNSTIKNEIDTTQVVIDKRNVSDVSWSSEELDKIRKSRTLELNIVEGKDIQFGSIQDIDSNAVDLVLAEYTRKSNDVTGALPASKYRATFTGLTYPEVLDLANSTELNNLDGERKKWSIAFNHIKNPSIGPWEEYGLYKDPQTNAMTKISLGSPLPAGVTDAMVHPVSKFEDFLRKTSFMDLDFILWKILCATTMDKEVVTIDCKSVLNGVPCGATYDWVYSPESLLQQDSISPAVMAEIEEVANASTSEEIMKLYNSSPVENTNYVELPTSKFIAIYGHSSAYTYLSELYSKIKELEDHEESPDILSDSLIYSSLTVIKAILIPNKDGGYSRITGAKNLIKVLQTTDEFDWTTITQLCKMMLDPYKFSYVLKDIICPKCHTKSMIRIDNIATLLFIFARSLSSTQIMLKSN